jgi:predicted esterase
MVEPEVRGIEARIHGRYVVGVPDAPRPWPMLIGFHGYGEDASTHFDELTRIPGTAAWLVVSVQALHRFYTRQDRVVASWMTRQDRKLAIGDNVDYVGRVLTEVRRRYQPGSPLVFAGFSQGGAMAYRAAAHYRADALIVLAADVPPDVAAGAPLPLPPTLIGRGLADHAYPASKQQADVAVLRERGVSVEVCEFAGGHEWCEIFREAAGRVLARVVSAL